jgi:hypothetical protein
LEDDAEVALRGRQGGDVALALGDGSRALDVEPGDGAQQGRLAAARGPQETDELAVVDIERNILESGEFPELLREIADPQIGLLLGPPVLAHGFRLTHTRAPAASLTFPKTQTQAHRPPRTAAAGTGSGRIGQA